MKAGRARRQIERVSNTIVSDLNCCLFRRVDFVYEVTKSKRGAWDFVRCSGIVRRVECGVAIQPTSDLSYVTADSESSSGSAGR